MEKRKKGNIILFGFAFLLAFMTLVGIYINVSSSYEVYNRVQNATEEGAKIRAQAVDIYLKEVSGIVEAFHGTGDYGNGKHEDVEHELHTGVAGHVSPLSPSSAAYAASFNQADEAAKKAIVSIAEKSLQGTMAGNEILNGFSEKNICVQVKPLPRTVFDGVFMDFECTTGTGETVKRSNVRVTPIESELNRRIIFDPDGVKESGDEQITEVVNVVFVGTTFTHLNFFEGLFPMLSDGNSVIPNQGRKTTWAIAYPQIDRCFGEFCENY